MLSNMRRLAVICFTAVIVFALRGEVTANPEDGILSTRVQWTTGKSIAGPMRIDGESWLSIKDPTIVRHEGKWHVFCTVRGTTRSHAIVYLSFADWDQAEEAEQRILSCHEGYFCAPQVFYFRPHQKWYMICQASDDSWTPPYQPAFATTDDLSDPDSWSPLTPLVGRKADHLNAWLDFWVIGDEEKAYLFFTSLDGKMWRADTGLEAFPQGWSDPVICLEGDIFEAGHIYRIQGQPQYLAIIEAQGGHGWRYQKSYGADRLDGEWRPIAATRDLAFASMRNVDQAEERWTDCISHVELIRAGNDERLEVAPQGTGVVFQGVLDSDRQGKGYGAIPWRLGLLESYPFDGEWISLFNGNDLEGWTVRCLPEDREKVFWKVTDGVIECDSLGQGPHDYVWLMTDKEYDDFDLRLKFQAFRESKGNSGVQIRSRYDDGPEAPRGGWLDGPQIDIHPTGPYRIGLIYDETREEKRWIYPSLKGSGITESQGAKSWEFNFHDEGNGWNDLRIYCEGTVIRTFLNGRLVSDYDGKGVLDDAAHRKRSVGLKGHIALQLHTNDALKIRFKDIILRESTQ